MKIKNKPREVEHNNTMLIEKLPGQQFTVKELIDILKTLDPDAEVVIGFDGVAGDLDFIMQSIEIWTNPDEVRDQLVLGTNR